MNNQTRYLFLDLETGGVDIETSILTAAFVVTDSEFEILAKEHWAVMPDNGRFLVDAGGMAKNRLDLIKLAEVAQSYSEASHNLRELIKKWSDDGKNKLIPAGYGVIFDVNHIQHHWLKKSNWEQFCSYRILDVRCAIQFLNACGVIKFKGGLEECVEKFGLKKPDLEFHDALSDTLYCIEVTKFLCNRFSSIKF